MSGNRICVVITELIIVAYACLSSVNNANANYCDVAKNVNANIGATTKKIATGNEKLNDYDHRLVKVNTDYENYITELNNINERLINMIHKSTKDKSIYSAELDKMYLEKQKSIEELQSGLYCSKCKRSKSQIEHDEKITFETHLNNVKGSGLPAPPDVVQSLIKKYDIDIKALSDRIKNIEKNIQMNITHSELLKNNRIIKSTKHDDDVYNISKSKIDLQTIMFNDKQNLSELNSSKVKYATLCKQEQAKNHDSLGYNTKERQIPMEAVVGKDLAALNSAIEKSLVSQAGSTNAVLFEQQDMPSGGRKGKMSNSWVDGEKALEYLSDKKKIITKISREYSVPSALVAAVANRESRLGESLDDRGYGDKGKAYGDMQSDIKNAGIKVNVDVDPGSETHYRQGVQILKMKYKEITAKFPDWTETERWRAAAAAYNVGKKNVRTKSGIDRGTTGNDYSGDVWAQAQWFALSGEFD